MPGRDPDKPPGYYCDGTRHKPDCPDRAACDGCLPPCSQRAGWGTDHPGTGNGPCKRHGGSTRNHRRAAEMEMAKAAVSKLDLSLTIGPVEALLDELHSRYRWKTFYEGLIMALPTHPGNDRFVPPEDEDDAGYWIRGEPGLYGRTYHVSGVPTGEAKPHVLVELYERERQQYVKVAAECVKANVSRRAIELAEDTARALAEAITFVVVGLGHDPSSDEVRRIGTEALLRAGGLALVEGDADAA